MNLEKVNDDKANADNVNCFMNGIEILLTPATETVRVGSGKKVKDIHFINAVSKHDFVLTEEDKDRMEKLSASIREEIARGYEKKTEEEAKRIELSEELSVDDLPFSQNQETF